MALEMDSWAVTGAQSSARIARLQLQSGTASGNGVVNSDHLQVLPLDVPGTSVRITSGGATILGREQTFQGSYFAFNVGDAELAISPTGSGGGRSDLVVLQVEDPNIDGTPWGHDVTTDPVYYFRVIEGVSSSADTAPSDRTAVALARIDIPSSTATITADMITDVRVIANPRTSKVMLMQEAAELPGGGWDEAGDYTADFERWPQNQWSIRIPEWATQAQVKAEWNLVFFSPEGGTSGTYDARGLVRVGFIGTVNVFTEESPYNLNAFTGTNGYRTSVATGRPVDIPEELRGATVSVRMYAKGDSGQLGRLIANAGSTFLLDITFNEVASPEATP